MLPIQMHVERVRAGGAEHDSIHVDDVRDVDRDVGLRRRAQMKLPLDGCQLLSGWPQKAHPKVMLPGVVEIARESKNEGNPSVLCGEGMSVDAIEHAQDVELAGTINGCGVCQEGEIDLHECVGFLQLALAACGGAVSARANTRPARRSMRMCAMMAGQRVPARIIESEKSSAMRTVRMTPNHP